MTRLAALLALFASAAAPAFAGSRPIKIDGAWSALHLLHRQNDAELEALEAQLPALAARGVNVIVLEVNYGFEFRSHPELRMAEPPGERDKVITKRGAKRLVKAARRHGIRVFPEFQSFGHQSWAKNTWTLLTKYPELDSTPGAFPSNEGLYCREWDPMNPRVYKIVYALLDEIIDAFDADAVHVGMDEVFLIGHESSPSTKGKDPAEVYAKAVNDMYDHIVRKRGRTMLMWGDRLIDAAKHTYGKWEASENGTWPAIDRIPKDIVICDWHYETRDSYPSVPMFLEKGFRVLPTSWKDVAASTTYIQYANGLAHPKMLGHLFTMWDKVEKPADWPPLVENAGRVRPVAALAAPR
jgi:hypothetical protein